jgi:hypothetical protein
VGYIFLKKGYIDHRGSRERFLNAQPRMSVANPKAKEDAELSISSAVQPQDIGLVVCILLCVAWTLD